MCCCVCVRAHTCVCVCVCLCVCAWFSSFWPGTVRRVCGWWAWPLVCVSVCGGYGLGKTSSGGMMGHGQHLDLLKYNCTVVCVRSRGVCVRVHVLLCVSGCARVVVCLLALYIHMHVCACLYAWYRHARMSLRACMYMHAYMHAYTRTHACVWTCMHSCTHIDHLRT